MTTQQDNGFADRAATAEKNDERSVNAKHNIGVDVAATTRDLFDEKVVARVLTLVGLSGGLAGVLSQLLPIERTSRALLISMLLPALLILIVVGWVAYRVAFERKNTKAVSPPPGREFQLLIVAGIGAVVISASAVTHFVQDEMTSNLAAVDTTLLKTDCAQRPANTKAKAGSRDALSLAFQQCDSTLARLARDPDSVAVGFAKSDSLGKLVGAEVAKQFAQGALVWSVTRDKCSTFAEDGALRMHLLEHRDAKETRQPALDSLRSQESGCRYLAALQQRRYAQAQTALQQRLRAIANALQVSIANSLGDHRVVVLAAFALSFIGILSLPLSVTTRADPVVDRMAAFHRYLMDVLATPASAAVLIALPWLGKLAPHQVPLRSASDLVALSSWEGIRINPPIPLADSATALMTRRVRALQECGVSVDSAATRAESCKVERLGVLSTHEDLVALNRKVEEVRLEIQALNTSVKQPGSMLSEIWGKLP